MHRLSITLVASFLFAGSALADTVMIDTGVQTYAVEGTPVCVPNLTPEQAAAYLNSTAEGRAASAKFDADLKKAGAQIATELADRAPRAELVSPPRAEPVQ
jgi:hypothetical protein